MRAANSARSSVNVHHSGCASCCRESETTSHVEIHIPDCNIKLTQNVSCLHFLVEIVIMQKYFPVWFPVICSLPVAHVVGCSNYLSTLITSPYMIFCLLPYLDFYEIFAL
jgi:hypothetical protein